MVRILSYGSNSLLVNFEQRISKDIHHQVLSLQSKLGRVSGIQYIIPAYCSLTISFDPNIISFGDLSEKITVFTEEGADINGTDKAGKRHEIPVSYGGDDGPDLIEVSKLTGKSPAEIIEVHTQIDFHVYMLGFMPGFAYMGDMPEEFRCPRRSTPRTHVPPGSVGLAGTQTAIYPFDSPGGWQIIGRTDVRLFDVSRKDPCLLSGGDIVRFVKK